MNVVAGFGKIGNEVGVVLVAHRKKKLSYMAGDISTRGRIRSLSAHGITASQGPLLIEQM